MIKRMLCLLTALLPWGFFARAAAPGDEVTVTFEIVDNPHGAISARVGFKYDDEVFEFVRSEKVSWDVLTPAPDSPEKGFGLVSLTGIRPGVLGSVTLRIREGAPSGSYAVLPKVDSVYNLQKETVDLDIRGGTVVIDGFGGGVALLPGDADGSGRVDLTDVLLTFKHITGWRVEISATNADINGNGQVDFHDAAVILLQVAGWQY